MKAGMVAAGLVIGGLMPAPAQAATTFFEGSFFAMNLDGPVSSFAGMFSFSLDPDQPAVYDLAPTSFQFLLGGTAFTEASTRMTYLKGPDGQMSFRFNGTPSGTTAVFNGALSGLDDFHFGVDLDSGGDLIRASGYYAIAGFDGIPTFSTGNPDTDFAFELNFQPSFGPIPEPATWGLMILGFGIVGAAARQRRRIGTVPATVLLRTP